MILTLMAAAATVVALPAPPRPGAPAKVEPRVLWTYSITSDSYGGAAVADADGDGKPEVAFGTYFGDSRVIVLNGEDGSEAWTFDAAAAPGAKDSCLDASCRWFDMDGDGSKELIVPVSDKSRVLCLEGKSGALRWMFQAEAGECIDTPPWIGDLDGTAGGRPEVIVGGFQGRVHVIGHDGSRVRALKAAPGAVQSCPLVLDVNGDGTPEIIVGNFRGDHAMHAVDSVTGAERWRATTGDHIYHGAAIGNLDGDGVPDLVFASYDGKVYAVRSDTGAALWTAEPGDHYYMSPMVATDLNGDGKDEVLAASVNLTCLSHDGKVIYSIPTDAARGATQSVTRGVSLSDIDSDGAIDAVFANTRGVLRGVRARDGEPIFTFDPADARLGLGVQPEHSGNGPVIADLNGDGRVEVLYVCGSAKTSKGAAIALTGFTGSGPAWPMFRGDPRNTGRPVAR